MCGILVYRSRIRVAPREEKRTVKVSHLISLNLTFYFPKWEKE